MTTAVPEIVTLRQSSSPAPESSSARVGTTAVQSGHERTFKKGKGYRGKKEAESTVPP